MTEEEGDKKREMITFGFGKHNKKHPEDCFVLTCGIVVTP